MELASAHPGLEAINTAPTDERAAALILPFIERAPAIASRLARRRPFADPDALIEAVRREVATLDEVDLLALLRGHPPLAPLNPDEMTAASQEEQSRLGLTAGSQSVHRRIDALNAAYSERFGFPFIIALHEHRDLDAVLAIFERRLTASREAEIAASLREIASVSGARIEAALGRAETAG